LLVTVESSAKHDGCKIRRVPQVTIENPILNSAFAAPTRHFKFDDEGITTEIEERRRTSTFFMPIARARKKGEQAHFDTEWTNDRMHPNTVSPCRSVPSTARSARNR
jgi:hypothetical protein